MYIQLSVSPRKEMGNHTRQKKKEKKRKKERKILDCKTKYLCL